MMRSAFFLDVNAVYVISTTVELEEHERQQGAGDIRIQPGLNQERRNRLKQRELHRHAPRGAEDGEWRGAQIDAPLRELRHRKGRLGLAEPVLLIKVLLVKTVEQLRETNDAACRPRPSG